MGCICLTVADFHVRAPSTDEEWHKYFDLRWRILRAPWNQPQEQPDAGEEGCIHRICCTADGRIVAAGRLHRIDAHNGQIRYMAVEKDCERKGYGTSILASLEQAALETGIDKILLHARESAVTFYENRGYHVIKMSHILFGQIQHYLMNKQLEP